MEHCKKHTDKVLTYRAGKERELFCKLCEREKRSPTRRSTTKKPWWKFW